MNTVKTFSKLLTEVGMADPNYTNMIHVAANCFGASTAECYHTNTEFLSNPPYVLMDLLVMAGHYVKGVDYEMWVYQNVALIGSTVPGDGGSPYDIVWNGNKWGTADLFPYFTE